MDQIFEFTEKYVFGEREDKGKVYNVLKSVPDGIRKRIMENCIFLMPFNKPASYLSSEIIQGRAIFQFNEIYNSYDPEFIIAHEIAHFIKGHDCYSLDEITLREQENEADELAKQWVLNLD